MASINLDPKVVSGINETALENLILEINNKVDDINTLLRQIEMDFYDTNDYFKGDVADDIRKKFDVYKSMITTVKENLGSYSTDLMNIKNTHKNVEQTVVEMSKTFQEHYKDEAKDKVIL